MQARRPARQVGNETADASRNAPPGGSARCLADLCKRLNGTPDPLEALGVLLQAAMEAVDAAEARGGIVSDDDVVTERLSCGSPGQLRRSSAATHATYQRLLRQPEVWIGNDGATAVPLVDSTKGLVAWIELKHTPPLPFSETEVELLEAMAAVTTLALETARMRCEHRHSSRASDEASSLLSATIESTLDGIMAVDANGDIVAYNRRFIQMWGLEEEDLTGGDCNHLLLSLLGELKDPVLFFEKVSELYWQPESESYDVVELRSGRCFERFSRPRLTEDGRPAGRVWTFHDVTELKKLENQLLHAQKMEAIGTLAGGIAHDFNNIMTAVIGYTDLLMLELVPPAPYRGFLENIQNASHRAIALVKNLLAFSREEALPTAKLECNALLQNVAGLMKRLIGHEVDFVLNLSSAPQGILVDQGQIEQVLVNLATNARDAMPHGGTLTIEVAAIELSALELAGHHTAKAGPYVQISFSDTGLGIDESVKSRIFDPFYTTKEVGKGSGLGLSISYGIVKRHGGLIDVASGQGRGTTFSVLLPKVELAPALRPHPLVSPLKEAGSVLPVDYDEPVRNPQNSAPSPSRHGGPMPIPPLDRNSRAASPLYHPVEPSHLRPICVPSASHLRPICVPSASHLLPSRSPRPAFEPLARSF
ncbi:sensor histidine kinase, PAS domain-containing [Citrifermentans bemidjiense Bem]|uniref:histidine kinase n=1 Tax=Citrifermentans bemidjiense (strain ATCC BAA-1014 / DSM 16622 / JCM 12645 / Bem) TaxID=404380 RepID=B5EB19_CITBB|nr:PAS domain-containing sensor histidine kinase [Citrifermentans bemidjiense]ACH38880.1 sensor histidine kinase, PAS domain-containing [Citrifermentans bemidjiense Bem]